MKLSTHQPIRKTLRDLLRACALLTGLVCSQPASADWHSGKVLDIAHDYNGVVAFRLVGYVRTNCACSLGAPTCALIARGPP
jgi:hypothetical protein